MANAPPAATQGDPELASISNTTKQIQMCKTYGQPLEFFHLPTRQLLCTQSMVDQQIDRQDCIEARQYCQSMM